MMYPRLHLAWSLLERGGFIAISIDDAEGANLRFLMNEVFGEENFIATLVFDRNRKNDAKFFSVGHEYMLVYARDKARLSDLEVVLRASKEGVEQVRELFEELRARYGDDFQSIAAELKSFFSGLPDDSPLQPLSRYSRVDARGPYRDDGNINWPGGGGPAYEVRHPGTNAPVKLPVSGWRYPTASRFWEEVRAGRIVFGPDHTTVPRVRSDLFSSAVQVLPSVRYSYAQTAANQFAQIFSGDSVFENPKPVSDLADLVNYFTSRDDVVLDFDQFSVAGHRHPVALLAQHSPEQLPNRCVLVDDQDVLSHE